MGYFCGLKGMMPGIQDMLKGVCTEKGIDYDEWLKGLKKNKQWHVEVYSTWRRGRWCTSLRRACVCICCLSYLHQLFLQLLRHCFQKLCVWRLFGNLGFQGSNLGFNACLQVCRHFISQFPM